ncbi:MAG: hypothetical protein A4E65_03147 [Syntrophorhabdus sp. PtaU1.Bin153]|nr:MAG: hypothetical protein A4E65_03147 [Syntrophorhabdus sp. PtaU1.Bin153]
MLSGLVVHFELEFTSNEFENRVMSKLDIPHFRQVEYIRDLAESARDLIARARKLTLYKA